MRECHACAVQSLKSFVIIKVIERNKYVLSILRKLITMQGGRVAFKPSVSL